METSELLGTITTVVADTRRRGLTFKTASDERLRARQLSFGDERLLSFASCSYLGLEYHPALIAGVHEAVDRYGTQFSASRAYVSAPQYEELEELLGVVFDGFPLVLGSTTLAHQTALPALVTEKDALVIDHQAHHSVHLAAQLVRGNGARVEVVRHGELEKALDVVRQLAGTHREVWFACDGVYSMFGDTVPLPLLHALLDVAPNVRLYIDDAHGLSWAGTHGRGNLLTKLPINERMVVATSTSKGFGAGGGVLVFATREQRDWIKDCLGTLAFCGPLQPPTLGAAVASARLHASDAIVPLQRKLQERIQQLNAALLASDRPPVAVTETPIFFVGIGLPKVTFDVVEELRRDGLHVTPSFYPAVPMRRSGLRFSLTTEHTEADIDRLVGSLQRAIPPVLARHGMTDEDVAAAFETALPAANRSGGASRPAPATAVPRREAPSGSNGLTVERQRTIRDVDQELWDGVLGGTAACSWEAMALAEDVFGGAATRPWSFDYVLVRDETGTLVAATCFTTSLCKDDMLMRSEISAAVEARRSDDPEFLTSWVTMTGSPLSEGAHLWVRRSTTWRDALLLVLQAADEIREARGATMLMLRDFAGEDGELEQFLLEQGLLRVPMLDAHMLEALPAGEDEYLASLSNKKKRRFVREQLTRRDLFEVSTHGVGSVDQAPLPAGGVGHLHALYRSLATRKLRINVFELPEALIEGFLGSPAWEIVTVKIPVAHGGPADGRPVLWYAAHVHGEHYAAFMAGFEQTYLGSHQLYRQMLLQIVLQARRRGARSVHLGMDATVEKQRYGARPVPTWAFVQADEHYNGTVLREIVAEVAAATAPRTVVNSAP